MAAWGRAMDRWAGLAGGYPALGLVDTLLRGTGQVMFQNNPATGLLFLTGIFYNSWRLGLAGLLGLVTSTITAMLLGADRSLVRNGLFGFNGILTGIALTFFLEDNAALVAYILLGGAVAGVVMAFLNLLSPWDMPPLTAPFVLTGWLLLAAVYQFDQVRPEAIAPTILDPQAEIQTDLREFEIGEEGAGLTVGNVAHGFFRGVGEVMFQDNLVTGAIFLLAIFVNSRISFLFAAAGSALGLGTSLVLGADGFWIYHGLYGFNSVLTGIALGGLFIVLTWRSAIYAIVGAIATAGVKAAISVFLSPLGLPALTGPFVLVTWLFLLPKAGFTSLVPVELARVTTPEQIREAYVGGGPQPGAAPTG